jgi:hypothetical protein
MKKGKELLVKISEGGKLLRISRHAGDDNIKNISLRNRVWECGLDSAGSEKSSTGVFNSTMNICGSTKITENILFFKFVHVQKEVYGKWERQMQKKTY